MSFETNDLIPKKKNLNDISETLSNLKFIGMVEKGEKMDVKIQKIRSNSIYDSILRFFSGESRNNTLDFLNTNVSRAFDILEHHIKKINTSGSSKTICKIIIKDLSGCMIGIENLKCSYKEDKKFICQIETLIDTIKIKLKEITEIYGNLFDGTSTPNTPISPNLTPQTTPQFLPQPPPTTIPNEIKT
jgi:hypothetical protein